MSTELALQNVISFTFTNYRGCIIEKTGTGYKAMKKEYPTIEGARTAIDTAFLTFAKTFTK